MAKVKKPVMRNGKIIGYRIYETGGFFGELIFMGYEWKKKGGRK